MDFLVAQMIHFVEDLPDEWQLKWAEMKEAAGGEHEDIPGAARFFRLFHVGVTNMALLQSE